jgi:hypothetical protein
MFSRTTVVVLAFAAAASFWSSGWAVSGESRLQKEGNARYRPIQHQLRVRLDGDERLFCTAKLGLPPDADDCREERSRFTVAVDGDSRPPRAVSERNESW